MAGRSGTGRNVARGCSGASGGACDAYDDGFTLVELLIVIVVLGLLATVTVFAVRGITDRGEESACAGELRLLTTAQEAHLAEHDTYVDEAGLVAAGSITSESSMYDVTASGDAYSIVPSATSPCTGSVGGGAPAAPAPPVPAPPAPDPVAPNSVNFGPVSGWQYGVEGEPDEVVVLGGADGAADFLAMIAVAPPTSRRVTFIRIADLDDDDVVDAIMSRPRTNGITDFAIYPSDDTSPLPIAGGGSWPSVQAYLVTRVGSDPLHVLGGGTTIEQLLLSIG